MKHTVCILCMYIIYIYAQSSLHSVIKPLYYLLDPVIYHIIAVYNSIYLHWYYLSIRIYIYIWMCMKMNIAMFTAISMVQMSAI